MDGGPPRVQSHPSMFDNTSHVMISFSNSGVRVFKKMTHIFRPISFWESPNLVLKGETTYSCPPAASHKSTWPTSISQRNATGGSRSQDSKVQIHKTTQNDPKSKGLDVDVIGIITPFIGVITQTTNEPLGF